ncbi:hypothetical protein AU255_11090 [Methyloprofundus sedimenti]|uniref:Uncharacterized protein n=1 Tax=Methyloprofundus sedimenti TaxID=1420851 RepID=A0A1V8MA11_9GAMM|nr:hypothetical protein [Methyloprofundus sedimenti]OQK18332.1 hypothetical protein AU255_11090 [Methyloprofundus sedimenti]
MKKLIILIFSALFIEACTDENKTSTTTPATITKDVQSTESTAKPESTTAAWNGSDLSDATIKQVQEDKYIYTQCVYKEAQKQGYQKIDSRVATDAVIKQCESDLTKIRTTFINAGVPKIIADRYLRKTRIEVTRKILHSLMFAEAARKAGATQ